MKLLVLDGNSILNRAFYGIKAPYNKGRAVHKRNLRFPDHAAKTGKRSAAGCGGNRI